MTNQKDVEAAENYATINYGTIATGVNQVMKHSFLAGIAYRDANPIQPELVGSKSYQGEPTSGDILLDASSIEIKLAP